MHQDNSASRARMKDTSISYDLVHHHHHQTQQQSHQHHPWNPSRQQQAHTTSVYTDQTNQQAAHQPQGQRSAVGHHHHHQQQQNPQISQYHHPQQQQQHQLQSSTHHASASAAYYQSAHLYPNYQAHSQDHQQSQAGQQHQHQSTNDHSHHSGTALSVTGASASVINAAQHHSDVHHQQAANSAQTSALNHVGWNQQSLGSMGHHAVVTDHSTLAYMTHAYQSHSNSLSDHHRNTNGPISTQPIGAGHQASTYGVESMYNSPAAAAAVAAYGYNNYNAAFFQSSNNSPHSQTGHSSAASLSAFWNHNQGTQQRQAAGNQPAATPSLQQRQPIVSEQAANYMHDPRMFYGRPNPSAAPVTNTSYNQGFGQAHPTSNPQADVLHHRIGSIPQQLLQHHEQLHQVTHQQPQIHNPALLGDQHQSSTNQGQFSSSLNSQPQQNSRENPSPQLNIQSLATRQASPPKSQRQLSGDADAPLPAGRAKLQQDLDDIKAHPQQSIKGSQQNPKLEETIGANAQNSTVNFNNQMNSTNSTTNSLDLDSNNKSGVSSSVARSDSSSQHSRKSQQSNVSNRNLYRAPGSQANSDDRIKPQYDPMKKPSIELSDPRSSASSEVRGQSSPPSTILSQDTELEESLGSLNISSRKTTWASIASQPAKVSQPKSLKSKIAGSSSVLSSAKHLAAVSLDTSSLESKNGINPAIKSSVSAAATSIQRNSVPPPISKVPSALANLKLNLLGDENSESAKISWPAVNASINLTLDDPPLKSSSSGNSLLNNNNDKSRRDDDLNYYQDHNHNQGSNMKMVNALQSSHASNRDSWNRRDARDQHDYRIRRNSDSKEIDRERRMDHHNSDLREPSNQRRDPKTRGKGSGMNLRNDEHAYFRDREFSNKRGALHSRLDQRGDDNFSNSRYPQGRAELRENFQHSHRESPSNRQSDNQHGQHHHYNNIRDGASRVDPAPKPDLNLHPHLNLANFNPKTFNLGPANARYFIIKSYSEDDIHRSIKYSIWCSTNHGNKRLDEAYRQQQAEEGPIYLFFSVNGSGHFCGMAQMVSAVDFNSSSGIWAQSKWQGKFSVKWIYVKDVPNSCLRHITLENNEDKPVTNSRDTQEVPSEKGKAVLKILHQYSHTTSLFDDFLHYERRQEEEKFKKSQIADQSPHRSSERERGSSGSRGGPPGAGSRFGRPYVNARTNNDFPTQRDRPSRFVPN